MEAKLAEYRAKKSAEKKVAERKNKIWNFFTLKFLSHHDNDKNDTSTEDAHDENLESEAWSRPNAQVVLPSFYSSDEGSPVAFEI